MHQEDRAEHDNDQSGCSEADENARQDSNCGCDLRQPNEIAEHNWETMIDCETLGTWPTEHAEQDGCTVIKERQTACDSEREQSHIGSCRMIREALKLPGLHASIVTNQVACYPAPFTARVGYHFMGLNKPERRSGLWQRNPA